MWSETSVVCLMIAVFVFTFFCVLLILPIAIIAGVVDEEKILEEMRAKIAEQDPLSKVCSTLSPLFPKYKVHDEKSCHLSTVCLIAPKVNLFKFLIIWTTYSQFPRHLKFLKSWIGKYQILRYMEWVVEMEEDVLTELVLIAGYRWSNTETILEGTIMEVV